MRNNEIQRTLVLLVLVCSTSIVCQGKHRHDVITSLHVSYNAIDAGIQWFAAHLEYRCNNKLSENNRLLLLLLLLYNVMYKYNYCI